MSDEPETPHVDQAELEALRSFFDCWCAFHEIQLGNRQAQERAAQRMVDAAHLCRSFRQQAMNG